MDFEQLYYGAQVKNPIKRAQSQSGGLFTVFAEKIINGGGIVYGVQLDSQLKAVYGRADTLEELEPFKGSKYVQVDVQDTYHMVERDLVNEQLVLFSGTPCHVHGLQCYLRAKHICTAKLFTCDLICHGVPSPLVFRKHIENISKHGDEITEFRFRDKRFGWHSHIETYSKNNSSQKSEVWPAIFPSSLCMRESCYKCKYASFLRFSDLTVGDFWGLDANYPEKDDNTGMSLVLVNSQKGNILFNSIREDIHFFETEKVHCLQPQLKAPISRPENRAEFWEDFRTKNFNFLVYRYVYHGTVGFLYSRIQKICKNVGIYAYIHPVWMKLKIKFTGHR